MATLWIANDTDERLRRRRDMRMFAQRVAWLISDNDVVVLPADPDRGLWEYIATHTGVDLNSVRIVVPPPGADGSSRILDRPRLLSEVTIGMLKDSSPPAEGWRMQALWPSSYVAEMAARLGPLVRLDGHSFLRDGGGQHCAGKNFFRAAASGAGVPTPAGGVAYDRDECVDLVGEIMDRWRGAVVKQVHNGAGSGNLVIAANRFSARKVAAQNAILLDRASGWMDDLESHWDWLSQTGRFPVVCEALVDAEISIFVEVEVSEYGLLVAGDGEMWNRDRPECQITPVRPTFAAAVGKLRRYALALCEVYREFGYRGLISVDAVVSGEAVLLTEANTQFTGSTHLYGGVGRVVWATGERDRYIREPVWDAEVSVPSFATLIEILRRSGLEYNPLARRGILVTLPVDAESGRGTYCAVGIDPNDATDLDIAFRRALRGGGEMK